MGLSTQNLRGVLLPFPTFYDEGGGLSARALRSNVERWSGTGITGLVAAGSTGERAHLSDSEYLESVAAARDLVPPGLAFVVGAGQHSTRATVDEVRRVAEAGADAVLVITPHYYRAQMTQGVLADYYRAVADASPAPVLLYNAQPFTGMALLPETIARLSEHENIVGVKDSSGDVLAIAEMVRLVSGDFAVLTGSGSSLYPALCVGARGGILAIGCAAPRLAVEIYDAFQAGEHERALSLQRKLSALTGGILGRHGIGGLKAALDMLGYAGGSVRAPLKDAGDEARREIEKLLRETGLLGNSRQ